MKKAIKVFFFKNDLNLFDMICFGCAFGAFLDGSYLTMIAITVFAAIISTSVAIFYPEGLNSK